ncbi:unnamed protein product [Prorocentrum cordatum]|uniref:Uncharacterized protein n=1 Tax=Prorocentrum cordatum TaxID=2364126 RepID=A0ABN9XZ20_9DINO|nr:unnamed protein product [Polarella glacialis]
MTESGKRDDVTLCMMLACVCHYIPNPTDATADRPKYLGGQDGDAYSGEVGPTRGPGQNARFAREERDQTAQQWAWHTWKKNEEITYASDVVWLCRLVLEDCLLVSSDDNSEGINSKGMRDLYDKIKTAYTPVLILPKWVPILDTDEDVPDRLGLMVGTITPEIAGQGKDACVSCKADTTKGALSVFETLANAVIGTKDDLEEPPETKKEGEEEQEEEEFKPEEKEVQVRLLSRPKPICEADVLACDKDSLERYDNQLSMEEAEHVQCILTAPRLCIPLLVQWFAQDRHGKLLQDSLRAVFHKALFEPGEFLTQKEQESIFLGPESGDLSVPLQLPEKPKKGTQADEDRHVWGRYTEYYRARAKFGTVHGRFFEELRGPACKELLANWNRIAYGASTLSKDSYRAAAIKLVEYFCRVGCEVAQMCRQCDLHLGECKEEYDDMVEWLGVICVQHLHTYISKVEADPDLDGTDRQAYLNRFQRLLLTLSEWNVSMAETPASVGKQMALRGKDTQTAEEKKAYDNYSHLIYQHMLSAAWLSSQDTPYVVEASMFRSRPKSGGFGQRIGHGRSTSFWRRSSRWRAGVPLPRASRFPSGARSGRRRRASIRSASRPSTRIIR